MQDDKQLLIVVCGATATGKTDFAVALAKHIDGEIISADSMQIYKYLDIGTAKVTTEEMQGIKHHLIDFANPEEKFSVADYTLLASPIIEDIGKRGKTAILCGGTGLYIDCICDGRSFAEFEISSDIISEFSNKSNEELYEQLLCVDSDAAEKIHPNNRKRILRALTVYHGTGKTFSQVGKEAIPTEKPYKTLVFHCKFTQRNELYEKIERRVDLMVEKGILNEAKYVKENEEEFTTAAAAIGYKEFFPYFDGTATIEECKEKLKQATRRYAKRQLTWFSRYNDAVILPSENPQAMLDIAKSYLKELSF